MHDVIIVGAGPAGLQCARLLKGMDILVLEEDRVVGRPSHCSGLISRNLSDLVMVKKSWIEHKVKGCILHSPGGIEIELRKPHTAAYVIDRKGFDRDFLKGLECDIKFNTRVSDVNVRKGFVEVKTNRGDFQAKIVLGCDGSGSIVRRSLGVKPRVIVNGLIAITRERDVSDLVDLWFNKDIVKDGFLWRIPRKNRTEYGIWGTGISFEKIESFFGIKKYEKRGGVINLGFQKTYFNRALLVGDSACQVKPWSGGGVVYGLICANIASEVVKEAFLKKDFSEEFLKNYETLWRKKIGRNIRAGMFMRGFYSRLSNKNIDRMFTLGRAGSKLKILNKLDMDFPV